MKKKIDYKIECPHCYEEIDAELSFKQMKRLLEDREDLEIECLHCHEDFDLTKDKATEILETSNNITKINFERYLEESNSRINKSDNTSFNINFNLKVSPKYKRLIMGLIYFSVSLFLTYISYLLTKIEFVQNILKLIREVLIEIFSDMLYSPSSLDFFAKHGNSILDVINSVPILNYQLIGLVVGTYIVYKNLREDLRESNNHLSIPNLFGLLIYGFFTWLFIQFITDIFIFLLDLRLFIQ